MISANPYLNFSGNTEEAFNFYKSVFGGEFQLLVRFRDFPDNPMGVSESDLDKLAHVALPLGKGNILMGTDHLEREGEPPLQIGNNFHITIESESEREANEVFEALSSGGAVIMPMQKTEWAEKYGMCVDKFGVQWMVNYTGDVQFPAAQ